MNRISDEQSRARACVCVCAWAWAWAYQDVRWPPGSTTVRQHQSHQATPTAIQCSKTERYCMRQLSQLQTPTHKRTRTHTHHFTLVGATKERAPVLQHETDDAAETPHIRQPGRLIAGQYLGRLFQCDMSCHSANATRKTNINTVFNSKKT